MMCRKCNRVGHVEKFCKANQTGCYECGVLDHFRSTCPTVDRAPAANQGRGRAFALNANEARQDTNVVTGTFPINDHYAFVLFDTGADKSFVSIEFAKLIELELSVAPEPYSVELANGKLLEANSVALGCTLNFHDHLFPIHLMPSELGSFDIVIGMDWMSANKAEIVCGEKMVRIPLPEGQLLEIHWERPGKVLMIISCMKARKYLLG
jgi:hypothetical protein